MCSRLALCVPYSLSNNYRIKKKKPDTDKERVHWCIVLTRSRKKEKKKENKNPPYQQICTVFAKEIFKFNAVFYH